jgi:hypothetical protein
MNDESARLIRRLHEWLDALQPWRPAALDTADLSVCAAWRYDGRRLHAVPHADPVRLSDLLGVERQKAELERNTRQFLEGHGANHALLTGARGTGKSTLVKALLNEFAMQGLRLIEVEREHLAALPQLGELLRGRSERCIVFSDDLSFEAGDPGYKALKSALDGGLAVLPDNVLIYATSNRRHLMPDFMRDNLEARHANGEIHPAEGTEEKLSLAERFGLWLSFYPFDQDEYLAIAAHWARRMGAVWGEEARTAALQWALSRGARSGRVARQFARDWAGRHWS